MIAGAVAASMARRRQQQRQRQKEQQRRREQQRKREQARRLQLRNRQRQEEQQQRNNHTNHNRMSLTSSFLDPDEIEAFVQEYNARRYSLANLEDEVEFLEQINALEVDFLRMFDATHRSSSSEEEDEEQEEAAYVQDRYNDFSFDIPTATVVATAEIVAEGHGGEEVVGEHIVQATEVVEQGHGYGTDYSPVPVTLPIIRGHKSSVCAIQ
jgi:hypothetical protein